MSIADAASPAFDGAGAACMPSPAASSGFFRRIFRLVGFLLFSAGAVSILEPRASVPACAEGLGAGTLPAATAPVLSAPLS